MPSKKRADCGVHESILHPLSANAGETILPKIRLEIRDNLGFPLGSLQILWTNIFTSSFSAFGLGREKTKSHVMAGPLTTTVAGF